MTAQPNILPPERTIDQRMDALQRANDIRAKRADDKKLLKKRKLDARQVMMNPPEHWEGARVAPLLLSIPGVGHKKVEVMLRRLHISPAKTLSGMTDSQRDRLVEAISRFYPDAA